jgi:signal transduction histidine kinase
LNVSTGYFSDYHSLLGEGGLGRMALVKISDTGSGIKPEHLKSLFTPFFTTKKEGTGLGLMMTQRIIKEHEGLLRVQTEPKKGSTFQIFLKLAKA